MRLIIKNIKGLVLVETETPALKVSGAEMSHLPVLEQAFLCLADGKIADFGPMQACPQGVFDEEIDATGRFVLPSFCDSHTHLVYAGSREQEFVDKINGLSYEEIARRGGGILNSAALLHETSEEDLFAQTLERAREIMALGTGAVEIKSGYGLNTEDELKMLRVARRIGRETPLTVRTTFLGAHAVPLAYKGRQSEYVDLIVEEMLPAVTAEGLADYVDAFCERGFFTPEDTARIFTAAKSYGLIPKLHANQMDFSGGVEVGCAQGAISVDHLEYTGPEQFAILKACDTMPTLLPGASMFLNMDLAPGKAMIQAGLPVALASNYNPGSCPSGDMKFMMALACIHMKLNPEEAIYAATLNGAAAMGLSATHGSIARGKVGNVFITKPIPSYAFLPYAFNSPLVERVILNGEPWK